MQSQKKLENLFDHSKNLLKSANKLNISMMDTLGEDSELFEISSEIVLYLNDIVEDLKMRLRR